MTTPKILFGIATDNSIQAETAWIASDIARDPRIVYTQPKTYPRDILRNEMVRNVLAGPYSHLMMLDPDVQPPRDIVDLLLECDTPMATAIVPMFHLKVIATNLSMSVDAVDQPVFMKDWERESGPFPVLSARAACVMIRREVFEKIPWPWFFYEETRDGMRKEEDVNFACKAAGYGFQYLAHPRAVCSHRVTLDLLDIVKAFKYLHAVTTGVKFEELQTAAYKHQITEQHRHRPTEMEHHTEPVLTPVVPLLPEDYKAYRAKRDKSLVVGTREEAE